MGEQAGEEIVGVGLRPCISQVFVCSASIRPRQKHRSCSKPFAHSSSIAYPEGPPIELLENQGLEFLSNMACGN